MAEEKKEYTGLAKVAYAVNKKINEVAPESLQKLDVAACDVVGGMPLMGPSCAGVHDGVAASKKSR